MTPLADMQARFAQSGTLAWIGIRPERWSPVEVISTASIDEQGLCGDHGRPGKRAVTLFQFEHLPVIGAMLGRDPVAPEDLRRNLGVAGLNLSALKGRDVWIGSALLRITGICAPCSRMEKAFGHGGYSAVRGHGGWTAEVVTGGEIRIGDPVKPQTNN